MEANVNNKFNIIINRLDEIIKKSKEDTDNFNLELSTEISDLEEIYNDLKEYVDLVKRSKAFKSISELYTNLINIKKLIIDLKEKKYKLNENDIRILKATSELMYKIEQANTTDNTSGIDVDIINVLKQIKS